MDNLPLIIVLVVVALGVIASVAYKRGLIKTNPRDVADDIIEGVNESAEDAQRLADVLDEASDNTSDVADSLRDTVDKTRETINRVSKKE